MTVYILLAIISLSVDGENFEKAKIYRVYSSQERCEGAARQLPLKMRALENVRMECRAEKVVD
jgi:hypothetical protein